MVRGQDDTARYVTCGSSLTIAGTRAGVGIVGGRVTDADATVFVVDDDLSVRRATERLVRSMGFRVETFASAKEFMAHAHVEPPACLVLDVHLPGLSGLDLQRELARRGV